MVSFPLTITRTAFCVGTYRMLAINILVWFPISFCLLTPWYDFLIDFLSVSSVQFSSVAQSCLTLCDPMNHSTPGLPCPSPTPGVYSNSCPSSRWCHPAISSSAVPFSSWPHSLPASESFPISQLFARSGQSTGVSASASVLPMNTQDWSPLGWTGWISLLSKGLSRVFSDTTVQKHQFFGTQLSSQSNSYIHTLYRIPGCFYLYRLFHQYLL